MAKAIVADNSVNVIVEYPREDQKMLLRYDKGPKEDPVCSFVHLFPTYSYEIVIPPLEFHDESLTLKAALPVLEGAVRPRSLSW